jgi:hypothetical protein
VRWGKGGGGRGDLTDVHPGVEDRRQGSRRRHAATAGGGVPRRRRSGGFPAAGSGGTGRVGTWMLLVGSVRPGDAPIRRIGDGRTGRRRRSVGRRRAVLARQGSKAAGLGRGARAGARPRLYRAGLPLQPGAHAKGTGGGHGCRPEVQRPLAKMGLCGPAAVRAQARVGRSGSSLRARPVPGG